MERTFYRERSDAVGFPFVNDLLAQGWRPVVMTSTLLGLLPCESVGFIPISMRQVVEYAYVLEREECPFEPDKQP